ncbi:MAG: hypothetical protein AAF549_04960 [Pseudomonadota bacterium]
MKSDPTNKFQNIENGNSYTREFFEELFQKIDLNNQLEQDDLRHCVISSAETYLRYYGYHQTELPPHRMKKELEKALSYIAKAKTSLSAVYDSGNYDREMANSLHEVIYTKYSSLRSLLNEIRPESDSMFPLVFPKKSLDLLSAMSDGIEHTLENYTFRKTTTKSKALKQWVINLAWKLEPAIKRKLEQSRYYEGKYISKRNISDAELLSFIITPLDSNVTITQLETAIKETHKERHL